MINRIRELRLKLNLSQEDLSKLSGVGRSTISEIEAFGVDPRTSTSLLIGKALRTPVEEIFKIE